MEHRTIQELPSSERPYEKAERFGTEVLSDAELLAVIIKTGTAQKTSIELAHDILGMSEVYPGLLGLYHAKLPELLRIRGIGRAKALSLMCVAELSKRMAKQTRSNRRRMSKASEIAAFFMEEMRNFETEHFYALFLDTSCNLIKYEDLFKGTVNQAITSPREALRLALAYDASQLVILHNHPSGDPTPSPADDEVTMMFSDACSCIGIIFTDHIIIGDNCYVSYTEMGCI